MGILGTAQTEDQRKESLPYNNKRRLLLAQHLNCLCVGGPPYWPSVGDATPALVGGLQGVATTPTPPSSTPPHPSTSHPTATHPLAVLLRLPSIPTFSILRRERLYTRLSVPLSGLRSYPPTPCTRPLVASTVRWRLLLPGMTLFGLAYRRSRYQPPSPSRWKGMPRRRRRSRGSYFIPEERKQGA